MSYDAALLAAGTGLRGLDLLFAGEIDNGFSLVRPPGHHAENGKAMGFCLFNNIAVAARYAINNLDVERVLLVDWDLHHGNGTQHAFYESDKVLYFSTHQYPYYPGTGAPTESGAGRGVGFTLNVALPAGVGDAAYAAVFNELLIPVARQYRPQLILLSAGYDIHQNDPLGGMGVTNTGLAYLSRVLVELAQELCDGRLFAFLEGGYDLDGLRDGVVATLGEMTSESTLGKKVLQGFREERGPLLALEETREVAKEFWKL